MVPGRDGRTYLTYVNVIVDHSGETRTVYMPTFEGAEVLNRAAAEVWEELGFEVRPVDCTDCSGHYGSLRCLVSFSGQILTSPRKKLTRKSRLIPGKPR